MHRYARSAEGRSPAAVSPRYPYLSGRVGGKQPLPFAGVTMIFLAHIWRFWTDSWSSPLRARLLYVAFALGFAGLAIGGSVKGDALVIALGAVLALATAALAVLAPRLAPALRQPGGEDKP